MLDLNVFRDWWHVHEHFEPRRYPVLNDQFLGAAPTRTPRPGLARSVAAGMLETTCKKGSIRDCIRILRIEIEDLINDITCAHRQLDRQ